MSPFKMMDETVTYCTRCHLDLNHRITLVLNGEPKRVLCLTCRSEHAYRRKKEKTDVEGIFGVKRFAAAKSSTKSNEAEWRRKLTDRSKIPVDYRIDAVFQLDDLVSHKVFGTGVVTGFLPPDKVQVFFEDGVKTLKCGKTP